MERQRTNRFIILPGGRKEDKAVSSIASAVDQFQHDEYIIAMVDPQDTQRAEDLIRLAIKRAKRTNVFDSYDLKQQELGLRNTTDFQRNS